MATPYMNLDLPVVSTTAGPAWATALNTALGLVDSHDHSSGKGVPIRTSSLFLDAGLAFGGYDATGLRSTRYTNHAAPLAGAADLGCLFVSGNELYYRDGIGNTVQVTSGGALNAASLGAIGGDYALSGASLFYTSAALLFSFESAAGVKAHIACGDVAVTEAVAGGHAATIQVPAALAANYDLTLFPSLPAGTRIVTLGATGALGATYDVDGSTLEVASSVIRVRDGGITDAKIASNAVTTAKILDANVTAAKTDAVSAPTASRLVVRDGSGRAQFADPSAAQDAATKAYVDTAPAPTLTALPLLGGWTTIGSGESVLSYWRDREGVVRLRGFAHGGGTFDQYVGTLPSGYRPGANHYFPCWWFDVSTGSGDFVSVFVNPVTGVVTLNVVPNDALDSYYFDAVSFLAGH